MSGPSQGTPHPQACLLTGPLLPSNLPATLRGEIPKHSWKMRAHCTQTIGPRRLLPTQGQKYLQEKKMVSPPPGTPSPPRQWAFPWAVWSIFRLGPPLTPAPEFPSLLERKSTKRSPDSPDRPLFSPVCSRHSGSEPDPRVQVFPGEWDSAPCPLKSTLRSWTARNGWLIGFQMWVWVLFLRLSNGRVVFPLEGVQEAEPRRQPRPNILDSAKLSSAADGHLWGTVRAQAPRLQQPTPREPGQATLPP